MTLNKTTWKATKWRLSALLTCLLFTSIHATAKSTDNSAPLHIEADQLEVREKDNISIYTGNVNINKGSLNITGDKITIKDKAGTLNSITIIGKPATFRQENDLNEVVRAESHFMHYQVQSGVLELKKNALLIKNKSNFSSEHIIYNTQDDIVKAGKPALSNTQAPSAGKTPNAPPRVKITIFPDAKTNNKAPPSADQPTSTIQTPPTL